MDHVAIMNPMKRPNSKELGMIEKILSGEKTVESRWLKNHSAPWKKVNIDDTVYFKYAGEAITAKATARSVEYIESIDENLLDTRLPLLAPLIGLDISILRPLVKEKMCGILIGLDRAESVAPFTINKTGFGAMAAWITIESIEKIRL